MIVKVRYHYGTVKMGGRQMQRHALIALCASLATCPAFAQTQPEGDARLRAELSKWSITDRTDNITGDRTLYAIQLASSDISGRYPALVMECDEGVVWLELHWKSRFASEYVPILLEWGNEEDVYSPIDPAIWKKEPYYQNEDVVRAPSDLTDKLISNFGEPLTFVSVTVYSDGTEQAMFATGDLKEVYSYIKSNCPVA